MSEAQQKVSPKRQRKRKRKASEKKTTAGEVAQAAGAVAAGLLTVYKAAKPAVKAMLKRRKITTLN